MIFGAKGTAVVLVSIQSPRNLPSFKALEIVCPYSIEEQNEPNKKTTRLDHRNDEWLL